jgi:metal-dependent amidase/aminoacylase/carboxypeptidase family protein
MVDGVSATAMATSAAFDAAAAYFGTDSVRSAGRGCPTLNTASFTTDSLRARLRGLDSAPGCPWRGVIDAAAAAAAAHPWSPAGVAARRSLSRPWAAW